MTKEIRLKIDKIEDNPDLLSSLDKHFPLLKDYMDRQGYQMFIHTKHTKEYF
ncbi:MAG TPA: hypothetical protein PLQ35_01765 [bacterium]|nr:hypothetical protein [bacterium]HQL60997.1 hypothetical protein [bacterium]